MSNHKPADLPPDDTANPDALVLPLGTLLPLVGGKAAQLGTLIGAGFAVPTGFCVTTAAYAKDLCFVNERSFAAGCPLGV